MTAMVDVQNPVEGNIPPIDDVPTHNQPFVQGAIAGAGTSTPNIVPSENTA